ncbi:MAG: serine hydrolase [Dermatophilaceae bacterium]
MVTLEAVARTAAYLGLVDTALNDQVRDERGPDHPTTLSTGTAAELCAPMTRLARGAAVGEEAGSLVQQWLSACVDGRARGRRPRRARPARQPTTRRGSFAGPIRHPCAVLPQSPISHKTAPHRRSRGLG